MEIGVYLFLSGIAWLVGLIMLHGSKRNLVIYSIVALFLSELTLVLFEVLTSWLMRSRTTMSWNMPGDYVSRGLIGWVIILVGLLGLGMPVLVAGFMRWQSTHLTRT